MVRVVYSSINFPPRLGRTFEGQNICYCTWAELVWAAITVGKAERTHLMRFGRYSSFEILYRASIIYANLLEGDGNNLCRSQAYDVLDPSGKGAVSYFLGLTSAKLLAEKLLNVPWLMHLDVYRDQLAPVLWRGKVRPDLVGLNGRKDWVIIEAKGRTNGLHYSTIDKAKKQTRNLKQVAGSFPLLRVALVSYFQSGELRVHWQDPEDFEENAPDLDIPLELMLSKYYDPFIHLFRDQRLDFGAEVVGNRHYMTTRIEDADMTVGVDPLIFHAETYKDIFKDIGRPETDMLTGPETDFKAGADGIFVRLGNSWGGGKMKLQPQERQK